MRYMGSKRLLVKHILPIMEKKRGDRSWIEPFVGGANMIDKVTGGVRIGNDINYYLIKLFQAVQKGWVPPSTVSKELYYEIKNNMQNYDPALVGFVGFPCSFGGRWWGGYAAYKEVNYAKSSSRALVKQAPKIRDIEFKCGDYKNLEIPPNSLIYCDPPYNGTCKYKDSINSEEFFDWCRTKSKAGHIVYVSEYEAPNDFECIFEIEITHFMKTTNKDKQIERLYKTI